MTTSWQKQLQQELVQAGASEQEADSLLPIATDLQRLHVDASQPAAPKSRFAFIAKPFRLVTVGVVGLAAGFAVLLLAQTVLPSSPLYAVQKFSDNTMIRMHPDYRGSVMMKRAQQVNALAQKNAGSGVILSTLQDYNKQAQIYKSASDEDAASAFAYCKNMLQKASAHAQPEVRQAIADSLKSLDTT
ncbi:MAG TPA: hypothetical protein VLG47_07745 [Candidatus Saccharimonadales bacterium]|nr:hypothetical protein [Candidatus Saccharimonadales bacterium]